ncbi:MAG: arginine--tRNA ligase, partial [Dehalococcoidia bacterium]|nr:arginine--tRNA ligase [Dehalococcoidia bacterium]
VALKLARASRSSPMTIASRLVELLPPVDGVEKVAVAAPGFINFTVSSGWLARQVDVIINQDTAYGNVPLGSGKRVQIEFVSVNPTGPLHVGHGRGAVLGSTLANILTAAGYDVVREYYVNDAGTQIDNFRRSLYVRYQQCFGRDVAMPSEGYFGTYLVELAREIASSEGDRFLKMPEDVALQELGAIGLSRMIGSIRSELDRLRVRFDVWFSESELYRGGQWDRVMAVLKSGGHVAQKENAVWFVSTALGEDKDNVLVRSNGSPTYFASDVAYHYNKFVERKFDQVINIWGADHQGHVSRMKAVVGALGIAPERLKIIITQLVTLRRGQEVVRLSKRSGDIITLAEVMDEVGVDACRFVFLSRSADSQMDFDLELVKKQSVENPVYYVQYAYARIASILRLAREQGIDFSDGDVSLLTHDAELALIRQLVKFPELVEAMAISLEPHHLPHYAQDLATVFHSFYQQCRVIGADRMVTKARLKLVMAVRVVLGRVLSLMGMTAPERM